MRITMNELTIDTSAVDVEGMLDAWRWLADESHRPILVSALGDVFLQVPTGAVFRLECGLGRLEEVAPDGEAFRRALTQRESVTEWFLPGLVAELLTLGPPLGPGEVYGWKTPPVLGGEFEPANFEPTDLAVHLGLLGQILEQVRDVPEGTPIRIRLDDPPAEG